MAKLKRDALAKTVERAKRKADRKAEEARRQAARKAEEARRKADRKAEEARRKADRKALEARRKAAEKAERERAAAEQAEVAFWESIKDGDDPADYQAYITTYPNGTFAALARPRAERKAPPVTKVVQIRAADDWQDSGVRVRRGQRFHLLATGTWSIGTFCSKTDASGSGVGIFCNVPNPWKVTAKGSSLIGRIGEDGVAFPVGNELELVAKRDGNLYLIAYDLIRFDNSGAVTVRITELDPQRPTSAAREVAALTPGIDSFDGEWVLKIVGDPVRVAMVDRKFSAPFSGDGWRGEISGKIDQTDTLIATGWVKRAGSVDRIFKHIKAEYKDGRFTTKAGASSTGGDITFEITLTRVSP